MYEVIDIKSKFDKIDKYWTPYIAAEVNQQQIKFAKLQGEFIWHSHANEDELFLLISGSLTIEFRGHSVLMSPGQMLVVPKGVEHKPVTGPDGAEVVLFEPAETKHTGNIKSERTVDNLEWI